MVSLPRRLLAAAPFLLALSCWAAEPVRIGVLAYPPKPWSLLAVELKRQIPEYDFTLEVLEHDALGRAVASRQVDFVLTNGGHYLLMQRRSGLSSPLATLVNEEKGQLLSVFGGAIIVRADRADIRELKDVRGKVVAFADFASQGAYQMQAYELARQGIDPQRDTRLLKTSLPHDNIVGAVLSGKADAGFVRAGLLEEMEGQGRLAPGKLRVLNRQDMPNYPWQVSTHLYPEWPFAALPHTDELMARRVTAVLLQLDRNPELVRSMKIAGFTVPADYQVMEDMLWQLRLPPFDNAARFTLVDVWGRYHWQVVSAVLLLGLMLLLAFRLLFANRRLHAVQQSLGNSEKHYRLLVEHMRDVVWVLDPDTLRFSYVSPSVERLRGYTVEEVMREPMDAALTPEFSAALKQTIRARVVEFESGKLKDEAFVNEVPQPCKDGSLVWTEAITFFYRNETTGKVEIHGVTRDISERKRVEEALRTRESELADAQRIAHLGSWHMDLATNQVFWSAELYKMYGFDPSQPPPLYTESMKLFTPDSWERLSSAIARAVESGVSYELELEMVTKAGGSAKWMQARGELVRDIHGKAIMVRGVVMDITERKQFEESLRRSNADLERFAYSVSHDMRQPLRAVSGHLQLLQLSMKDKLDEDERENMGFALEGARRMDSMIVSLLDYSRVGRKTESKQWIASRASLDEALGFLAPLIGEAQAEVKLDGEWPQVFASRDELTRLFQNLVGNAVKFREAGQVAHVEVGSSVHGGLWRVSVRDQGVGIDPQQLDRLFQFFSRLQSRARFEGTGMGLALCRRIVEHHNGHIWAESEGEGKGSAFIFELPLEPVPAGS